MDTSELTSNIKQLSHALGFNLVGVAKAKKDILASKRFKDWLDMGYNGSMKWLNNRQDEKTNIFKYFPQVKSVISFGYNYYSDNNDNNDNYKISNYSWGDDYQLLFTSFKKNRNRSFRTVRVHTQ